MTVATEQSKKAIGIFLLLTFLFSSLFYFFIIYTGKIGGGMGTFVTGLMWSPGTAAIVTCIIMKRDLSTLGWRWGNPKYQWLSYFIPLLYATIAYLIIWLTGLGGFYEPDFVKRITTLFGWEKLPASLVIVFYFILMGVIGMARSCATALGEEIGWRGFLAPELFKSLGYTKTSLLTGAIWSMWHFPILIFADYNSGTPAWFGLSCFTVMVVSISFVFTWFRMRSGSLWTGVLLHASHNLFIQSFFTPLTKDTGNTKYFIDEFGVVLPVITVCFAIYFWSKRKELE